jgi:hypothetical protein
MLAEIAAACIYAAAQRADLPPPLLMSVLRVEAGHEGTRSHNRNGTDDLGPGQINSAWLDLVARAADRPKEEIEQLLQWDGCFNIKVTAGILRHEIDQAPDFWTGVGHYHSHRPAECLKYIGRVVETARRLFGPAVFAAAPAADTAVSAADRQNLPGQVPAAER